jgi:2-oxoglutarate dehydrogenase E1 component
MRSLAEQFAQFGQNSGYVEELYQLFLSDPGLVGESWSAYFSSLSGGPNGASQLIAKTNGSHAAAAPAAGDLELQQKASRLVEAFRSLGHLAAKINPLKSAPLLPVPAELSPEAHGIASADLQKNVYCAEFAGRKTAALGNLIEELRRVYCGSIGFEFTHIVDSAQRQWLQSRIEGRFSEKPFSATEKKKFLDCLIESEGFESELHKTYVGAKRFSVQGGETCMPMLDTLIEHGAALGIKQVTIGMAHRGRLNVLAHTVGKPYANIFGEFEDQSVYSVLGSGDVKYHLGYEGKRTTNSGASVTVELAPNPSHLEFVNPVVSGIVRARQDASDRNNRKSMLPVLIHGDAAVIGQGVVWETFNMGGVEGYTTAGALHLVLNNQVGFTTDPRDSRTSIYCTDTAKAIQSPVFHVNCEDVDACCWATKLALDFRQKFEKDVFLDLYCFRKYGHNEGDDPSFTQPTVYNELASKKSVTHVYAAQLMSEGVLSESDFKVLLSAYVERFKQARNSRKAPTLGEACAVYGRLRVPTPATGVAEKDLKRIGKLLTEYPAGFTVHPKLHKILEKRVETLEGGKAIDWGFAEALAFGSLVMEGRGVRLSGQDAGRGTFSQRHLALTNYEKGDRYLPFSQLDSEKAKFEVVNSTLSEASVMGFEFGYASVATNSLVLWEGQFGDFANGAQVIIDQFIASSESKWGQLSGIVLMLPHGFEGQGPEHSSARLERYLQLCGEGNMVVAYPTSADQHFHLLRRQGVMEMKRPLIIMTPKSLLRLPQAACELSQLTSGEFQTVIETDFAQGKAKKVILCSGKVYYDIQARLEKDKTKDVTVLRIEQLYPFPQYEVKKVLKNLSPKTYLWVQEEPQNMGAWSYIEPYLRERLELSVSYIGRPVAASPATGSGKRSAAELQAFLDDMMKQLG